MQNTENLTALLDAEIAALDTTLVQLTSLRLVLGAGAFDLIDEAAAHLVDCVDLHEAAARHTDAQLLAHGFGSVAEAADALGHDSPWILDERRASVSALHRNVCSALACAAGSLSRSLRDSSLHLPAEAFAPVAGPTRHPFLVEA